MNTLGIALTIIALLLIVKCDQRVIEKTTDNPKTSSPIKLGSVESSFPDPEEWTQDTQNDLSNLSWDDSATKDMVPPPKKVSRWEAVIPEPEDTEMTKEKQPEKKKSAWQALGANEG